MGQSNDQAMSDNSEEYGRSGALDVLDQSMGDAFEADLMFATVRKLLNGAFPSLEDQEREERHDQQNRYGLLAGIRSARAIQGGSCRTKSVFSAHGVAELKQERDTMPVTTA